MDAIDLSIFSSRIDAICEEMGVILRRTAFSPNIVDRLDFSCAIFDAEGQLCAQAAHIPVHLGSMAFAMSSIISQVNWQHGDMIILNDPYMGGTHLPDVTLIAPLFFDGTLQAFVANRAHHADIGADSPGSMPLSSTLQEEGLVIPPTKLVRKGVPDQQVIQAIIKTTRQPDQAHGDFSAQVSACQKGLESLLLIIQAMGCELFQQTLIDLNDYGHKLSTASLSDIPDGRYQAEDVMDDDGLGSENILIKLALNISADQVELDFTGTADQVSGNINCPLSVTAAAAYYVFRCLMPDYTPACQGSFRNLTLKVPEACLLNATYPAAVAAGNVETSTRIVDVILAALAQAIPGRIPAASHGSMNNLAMGSAGSGHGWDYYETMGGGMGASQGRQGISAVQTHMTNTLNTPIEVLEKRYPVRIKHYAIRHRSGGKGLFQGGDGLIREFEFLKPAQVTLLTERRTHVPWGLAGGESGQQGCNQLNGKPLPGKISLDVVSGDILRIETPGGGGWGKRKL